MAGMFYRQSMEDEEEEPLPQENPAVPEAPAPEMEAAPDLPMGGDSR